MSPARRELVERLMGATVALRWGGIPLRGTVVFVDYTTLTALVNVGERELLVPWRRYTPLEPRLEHVGVRHGVRLDVWRYGTGWHGCHLAAAEAAAVWLEPEGMRAA